MTTPRFPTITDEALASLRALIGRPVRRVEPYLEVATRDAIRHWAHGVGDRNPVWAARRLAPPTILLAMDRVVSGYVAGLPGIHAMYGGADFRWRRPIREGDRIVGESTLLDLEEKPSAFARRAVRQTYRTAFADAAGAPVGDVDSWCFRTERDTARERGKYAPAEPHRYTVEEIERIRRAYGDEAIRGATPRFWEDVRVGEALGPVVKGPLTVTSIIAFLQGWGSLYVRGHGLAFDLFERHPALAIPNAFGVPEPPERVHWDADFARAGGRSRSPSTRSTSATSRPRGAGRPSCCRSGGRADRAHAGALDPPRAPGLRADGGGEQPVVLSYNGAVTTRTSSPADLTGTVALVTGAARGIGQATALALAAVGADVTAGDLQPPADTRARVEALGCRALALRADVTDRAAVEAAVAATLAGLGRLDVVVNNAGITERLALEDLDGTTLQRLLDVVVKGTVFVSQAAYPHLKARGGAIVNIASVSGMAGGAISRPEDAAVTRGGRSGPAYAAAKGAVIAFTRWLAKDAGRYGVRVNAVAPGPVATEMTRGFDYDVIAQPISRMGHPEERAPAGRLPPPPPFHPPP